MRQKVTIIGSTGTRLVTTLGELQVGVNTDFIRKMLLEMEQIEHDNLLPGERFVSEMLLICCFEKPKELSRFFYVNGEEYLMAEYAYRYYPDLKKVLIVVKQGNQLLIGDEYKNTTPTLVTA